MSADPVVALPRSRDYLPDVAVNLDQLTARGQAIQLFQQQTPFPATAKTQLSNQLFVPGALTLRMKFVNYLRIDSPFCGRVSKI